MESSIRSFFIFEHVWHYLRLAQYLGIFPCKKVQISNGLVILQPLPNSRIFAINLLIWTICFSIYGFVFHGALPGILQSMDSLLDLVVVNLSFLPFFVVVIFITLKNSSFKNDLARLQDIFSQVVPDDLTIVTHLKPAYGLFTVCYAIGM